MYIITESKLRKIIKEKIQLKRDLGEFMDKVFGAGVEDSEDILDVFNTLSNSNSSISSKSLERSSKSINDVDPSFVPIVKNIMKKLRSKGHEPIIGSAYRSPEEQKEKIRKGYSKTKSIFGFHVSLDEKGNKSALAVDLVDSRYGWGAGNDNIKLGAELFFKDLGEIVNKEFKSQVEWGGNWSPKEYKVGDQTFTRGWDPAHIETKKMTMSQSAERTKKGMEYLVNKNKKS